MSAQVASVGCNYKLYRNTGTWGSPTWLEVTTVRDNKLSMTKSTGDGSARLSTFKLYLAALKDVGIEYELLRDANKSETAALRDSYINDTVVNMAVCDQAIANSGAEYFKVDTLCTEFSRSEPLEGAVVLSVKQVPAYSSNVPLFVTVS